MSPRDGYEPWHARYRVGYSSLTLFFIAMYEPTHVLSKKSARQHRNIFIWCTRSHKVALGQFFWRVISKAILKCPPGWHVGNDNPTTVSTAYRWITDAVLNQSRSRSWKEAERYTLFPVEVRPSIVMTYSVHKNGAGLSRESQDIMVPGDYGLYTIGKNTFFCTITCWMSLTRRRCQAVLLLPATSFICEHGGSSRRK